MTECPLLRTLWLESELFREHCVKMFGRHGTYATAAQTRLHVHHIFGGKTRKDSPSNTITICGAVHDFCHTHQTEGRIACLWWKWNAGELIRSEIDEAAGYSVTWWLHVELHHERQPPFNLYAANVYHGIMLAAEAGRHATER